MGKCHVTSPVTYNFNLSLFLATEYMLLVPPSGIQGFTHGAMRVVSEMREIPFKSLTSSTSCTVMPNLTRPTLIFPRPAK